MTHHHRLIEQTSNQPTIHTTVCLQHLFELQVTDTPDAPAVVFEGMSLSYQELDRRANQLAHYLQSLGVGPDVRVGIYLERSLALLVGLFGILKAGGAYVPLDPMVPGERLVTMLADAQALVLLTQESLYDALPHHDVHTICLDSDWYAIAQMSDLRPMCAATPANLVYVLFTSGSTGRPKGVAIEHRQLVSYLNSIIDRLDIAVGDSFALVSTFAADLGNTVLFPALCTGGCLHVISYDRASDPRLLADYFQVHPIDYLKIVPSHLLALLATDRPESVLPHKRLVLGGEASSWSLIERLHQLAPWCRVLNHYGPTETTVGVLTYRADLALAGQATATVPIGYALDQVALYVLNADMSPVAFGESGELYVGGEQLARGYLGRPDLTAERFVPNPFMQVCDVVSWFSGADSGLHRDLSISPRLYRTGDLVRWMSDESIVFLGRVDHQVKIRGFRIELGEIETALRRHGGIQAAIVLVREDIPDDRQLVAYVVPQAGVSLSAREVRSFLKQYLPDYMLPASFVQLSAMPLTPNGKIDRQALPAPDRTQHGFDTVFVAPRTPLEELIAGVWADVLMFERVGIHDNFFELGGHSLMAAQVVARLRATFQIELPLRSLFDAPTIAGMAETLLNRMPMPRRIIEIARLHKQIESMSGHEILARLGGKLRAPCVPGEEGEQIATVQEKRALLLRLLERAGFSTSDQEIPRRAGGTRLPLSLAQQRLWFLDLLTPEQPFYNLPVILRMTGELNLLALNQSLTTIVERHEALRTVFAFHEGQPIQVITPAYRFSLPLIDCIALPDDSRMKTAQRLMLGLAQRPFDLIRGPLFRATLLRLDEQKHILFLTMHHIISDGWSLDVLLRELSICYDAFQGGGPCPLAPLPIQYGDFSLWQRQQMSEAVQQRQRAYWQQHLRGAPALLELPTDRPRPAMQSYRGETYPITIPTGLRAALVALSHQHNVTLFMTLLAAFQVLLARYSGREDVVVGSPVAGRTRTEVEGLIGFFVNMLVLRTHLTGDPTGQELLARVRETCLGAYAHQDLPFEQLVEELQPERNLSFNPLFQVVLALQNDPVDACNLTGLTLERIEIDSGRSRFDISILLKDTSHELTGVVEYNSDLFDMPMIALLVSHFQTLLESLVTMPDQHISRLPLLSVAEEQCLLISWNATQRVYPREHCIHELFDRQADLSPDAVALSFSAQAMVVQEPIQLSYRELGRRANQLAHTLRAQGVGPEVTVGLYVERSIELVIALLGILKAGGVYLPLDANAPSDRLAFMLTDAQAPLLLTQRHLLNHLPVYTGTVLCFDDAWMTIGQELDDAPVNVTFATNLAYINYTSGSTGKPKGTSIPHRGVLRLVLENDFARLSADEVLLQFAPVAFDAATFEIWGSLLNGGRLAIFPAQPPTLAEIGQVLVRERVTTLWLTSGLFHQMVESQIQGLRFVRQLLAGGDVLSVPHVQKVLRELPQCHLVNGYGPTECTTFSCCYPVIDQDEIALTVPIGRPIANTQVYVLDRQFQPVPISVPGELYIGGDGLARGYLNQPDLTAAKFIPNPFSHHAGERLYRTGDLVRYRSDSTIEFLGRIDQQVKIRGFRIELGEIESQLLQHPDVREASVIAREDEVGGKRLVAYLVLTEACLQEDARYTQTALNAEMRGFMLDRLPEYMVPSAFVVLGDLPLTANGKLDRRALPAPESVKIEEETYVEPKGPVEEVLAGIWADLLGLERVGAFDNFFEMGGHSLLATRVVAQIHDMLKINIPLRSLFEAPTVAGLADLLAEYEDVERLEHAAELLIWLAQTPDDDLEVFLEQREHMLLAKEV